MFKKFWMNIIFECLPASDEGALDEAAEGVLMWAWEWTSRIAVAPTMSTLSV